ncbi:MAG: beta-galactosidase [Pseudomonadota bacterium]
MLWRLRGRIVAAAVVAAAAAVGSAAAASPAEQARRVEGIHYAVERNVIMPSNWRDGMRASSDCRRPACEIAFDQRLQAVHLRLKWSQLNPAPGEFDFSALGGMLDAIAAQGKTATLAVMAGKYAPRWVADRAGTIDVAQRRHSAEDGSIPFVPRPWTPAFIDAHGAMIAAMARYLKRDRVRYETLALVKNAGVVTHSAEIRLMPEKAYAGRHLGEGPTARIRRRLCRAWRRAGYSEDRVLRAMREMSAQIADAFPDKLIGMAFVVGSKRFPTIRGQRCRMRERNATLNLMIQDMVETYGDAAVINSTTLHERGGDPPILDWVRRRGGRVAFQLNRQLVGCSTGSGPSCRPDAVNAAMAAGLAADALFIEVHDGNIHRHRALLAEWNRLLRSRAAARGTAARDAEAQTGYDR